MIYLVEDDNSIRELVIYTLQTTGFPAKGFACAADFWEEMKKELPSLVLLDIMLPDEDGLSILRKIRESSQTARLPVMMVTAKGTEYDKVLGLDSGADDYIPKPFGMMELVSRVKAVLRRCRRPEDSQELVCGKLRISVGRHEVYFDQRKLELTRKEFELLQYLVENAGMVMSRNQILGYVWGYDFDGETRTVDVHVRALRQKLGEAGEMLETVRGVGYRIIERK